MEAAQRWREGTDAHSDLWLKDAYNDRERSNEVESRTTKQKTTWVDKQRKKQITWFRLTNEKTSSYEQSALKLLDNNGVDTSLMRQNLLLFTLPFTVSRFLL